jgi:hypothetical protein
MTNYNYNNENDNQNDVQNENQNINRAFEITFYLEPDNDPNRSESSSIDFSVLNFSQFNSPSLQFQEIPSSLPELIYIPPTVPEIIKLNEFLIEVENNCTSINKTFNNLDDNDINEIFAEMSGPKSVKYEVLKNIKIRDLLYDIDGNIMLLQENICKDRLYCDIIQNLKIKSTQFDDINYKILFKNQEISHIDIIPIATTLSNDLKIKIEKDDIISDEISIHYIGYILDVNLRKKIMLSDIEDDSGYSYNSRMMYS